MSELFGTAVDAARRIRCGELSSRELTEAMLQRIDALNPEIGAVVALRRGDALREARDADEAVARGDELGPLHGVPITVKDGFHVAGLATTWGNPDFAAEISSWDATVVRRLRAAGAVIAGTTNVHHMLGDFGQTANDVFGRTANPWDPTRTPGGSSGGSAAALAAGMTMLEYGSDLVGSIRIPASFCGVYGLRPSVGTVPSTGMAPPGPREMATELTALSVVGPLARSAGDLRVALRATAGPEGAAVASTSWALAPPRHTRLRDHRIRVILDDEHAPVSSDVGSVLSDAVDALAKAGVRIVEGWPAGIDPGAQAASFGFGVGMFFALQGAGDVPGSLAEFVEHEQRRMRSRAVWAEQFRDVDVVVCPTNFTAAFPHDTRPFAERTISTPEGDRPYDAQVFWVAHAALPGLPAVSAPVGRTASGLPVGAQLIGPLHEDDTAITFAELVSDVVGGYEQPR